MINTLKIQGLRGFDRFELRGLETLNLLVGPNNCGKTTVLESIQMVSSPADLSSLIRILSRRGEDWFDASERGRGVRNVDVRRLFFGHSIRIGSRFSVTASANGRPQNFDVEVVDASQPSSGAQPLLFDNDSEVGGDPDDLLAPSALRVTWDQPPGFSIVIPMNRRGGLASDVARRLSSVQGVDDNINFITTASLSPSTVIELFESVVLTPEEQLVIEALQIIEPSIERIATGSTDRKGGDNSDSKGGVLVRCKGVPNRIPIGSMGDGIWRMLGLALAMVRSEGGILLVDEIDTGLHFTVMENMWKLIYQTAKRLDVQVFATTHSRDCYESLAAICKENAGQESDITIQRIERGKTVAVGYTEQEIIAAAERGMEVR